MRRLLTILLLGLSILTGYAMHVECVGTACMQVNGQDTCFVFAGAPHLRTQAPVDWYRLSDNTIYQSNTTDIFPDGDGLGLYIEVDGVQEVFYVFDYSAYTPAIDSITVEPYCRATLLHVHGAIPALEYTTAVGMKKTLPRTCRIGYTDISWGGDAWQDSVAVVEENLHSGTYNLPAFYQPTEFYLAYDNLHDELGLSPDTVYCMQGGSIATIPAIAVKAHPTSQTTVRGEAGEQSNEVDRPTEVSTLTGSAPLEIHFRSNPSPAVDFYMWKIYKENSLLANRNDEEQRYTFMDHGNYRVVCWVSNTHCPCTDASDPDCAQDSVEFKVSVSESQLRVPNVFTPNGDGKNDEFRVMYRSIREFHCWVYNRWGKLVYEWTDPAKGWDGTINGRPAAEGAYFYVIRALGTDAKKDAGYISKIAYDKQVKQGDIEALLGVYQLSGDINLIRGKH